MSESITIRVKEDGLSLRMTIPMHVADARKDFFPTHSHHPSVPTSPGSRNLLWGGRGTVLAEGRQCMRICFNGGGEGSPFTAIYENWGGGGGGGGGGGSRQVK